MPTNFNVPQYPGVVPWFMFDIFNLQLIVSRIIPTDISDTKGVILTETPIPGKNFQPVTPAGNANRKISFTLPLIKRNNTVGNVLMLKQFDSLRNQATGLLNIRSDQFTPNPKVLYSWGTGSVPLIYWVSKCDATHKQGWVNQIGNPQYSEIEIELILDETHPLYRVEEVFRRVSSVLGEATAAFDLVSSSISGGVPY